MSNWATSWPSDSELEAALAEHGSQSETARHHGVSREVIRRHLNGTRRQIEGHPIGHKAKDKRPTRESSTIEIGKETASAEFVEADFDPNKSYTDRELIELANLDHNIWEVTRRSVSVWEAQGPGGIDKEMRSLKVGFGKIKESLTDLVRPAFNGSKVTIKAPARRKENKRDTELVVVVSDFHAPYHDERLLELCQQYLLDVQPDRLIINGDLVDFPNVSRHRKTTNNKTASANECVQVGGEILAKLRASVPEDCRVQFIPGNHDGWLSTFLLNQAGPAYDLCVAGTDVPVWSLQNLLRFDELGIEMIGSEDQWGHAVVQLTERLVVRHGDSVRAGSGSSVLANMKSSEYATISGHTHRAGVVSRCVWAASGEHLVLQGAEVGGMFSMPSSATDWPTYTQHNMDWSPGFAVVEVEQDSHYSIDLATYQNGVLMVRGERY